MAGDGYRVDVRGMDDFSPRDLYAMLRLRVDVFVVEQKCPYPELDGKDGEALHLRFSRAMRWWRAPACARRMAAWMRRASAGSSFRPRIAASGSARR